MLTLGRKRKLRHATTVTPEQLQDLKTKAKNEQALFEAYSGLMLGELHGDLSDETFWSELTKQQQTLAALSVMVSQVNNGGIWQFLFNKPEFSIALGESLDHAHRLSSLLPTYNKVLREFAAMHKDGTWNALMEKLADVELSTPEAWNLFVDGGKSVPSGEKFNEIFFKDSQRKRMFSTFNRFVEQNIDKLVKVKGGSGSKKAASKNGAPPGMAAPTKKKDAIPYYTRYLEEQYGTEPAEVSVYYSGKVTIDSQPTQLFLMKYKMPDGFESLGVTGFFTRHFPDLTWAEVSKMRKQQHKQKLVNIFYGAYLVDKTLAEDPTANQIEPGVWESYISRIQGNTSGQIPVNVTFKEYFKFNEYEVIIYRGDLYDCRSKAGPPRDPQNVSIDKKDGFSGEIDRIFHSAPSGNCFGGRGNPNAPVEGRYKLYSLVGGKNKLLKDNPWGF